MNEFKWDFDDSYDGNFNRWWHMNTLERECWNEPKLEKEAAEELFRSLAPKYQKGLTRWITRRRRKAPTDT